VVVGQGAGVARLGAYLTGLEWWRGGRTWSAWHRSAAAEVRPVAPTLENGGQAVAAQPWERRRLQWRAKVVGCGGGHGSSGHGGERRWAGGRRRAWWTSTTLCVCVCMFGLAGACCVDEAPY
jgi:hypothetical protein